jgi:hypothetical protein
VAGLALSTGYLLLGGTQHHLASRMIEDEAFAAGHTVRQAGAYPRMGSVFLWRLVYGTDEAFYVAGANTFRNESTAFEAAPISEGRSVEVSADHPKVKLFAWFARGMVRPERSLAAGREVVFWHDMRYGWPMDSTSSLWWVVAWLDGGRQVEQVTYTQRSWRSLASTALHR